MREDGVFRRTQPEGGRRRRLRDKEIEDEILEHFQNNSTTSARSAARVLQLRQTTVWEVLNENGQHPFHVQRVQELNAEDHPRRVQYARLFLHKAVEQPCFPSKVLFTDEALFTREGIVNVHNLRLWSAVNLHVTRQCNHQDRFSVNVWEGILGDHVIGPYILTERQNGRNYGIVLNEVLPELLKNVPLADLGRMWFQHDGAPAHFTVAVIGRY